MVWRKRKGEKVGEGSEVLQGGEPRLPKVLGSAGSAVECGSGSDHGTADCGAAGSGEVEKSIVEKCIGGEVEYGM